MNQYRQGKVLTIKFPEIYSHVKTQTSNAAELRFLQILVSQHLSLFHLNAHVGHGSLCHQGLKHRIVPPHCYKRDELMDAQYIIIFSTQLIKVLTLLLEYSKSSFTILSTRTRKKKLCAKNVSVKLSIKKSTFL